MKNRWLTQFIVLIAIFSMLTASCARPELQAVVPHSVNFSENPPADLTQAFAEAVSEREDAVMAFVVYDVLVERVTYSNDNQLALLWLVLVDKETGEVVPSEPGLAIARREMSKNGLDWVVTMQVDEGWMAQLAAVPDYLLPSEARASFEPDGAKAAVQTFSGYKLPWAAGNAKRLTQSIGHKYIYGNCPTCLYAFDFADGTQFPLLASKGGTVKFYNWNCPNNNHSCNNYVVLEDQSTSPTTYQLYLHMAYNTIPPALRSVGAVVQQGQYIGNVDNTGASTGSHLHFQVHTTGTSWWGTAQDVQFADVDINGGRPRMCTETNLSSSLEGWYPNCHSGGDWYISGNAGAFPPAADLTTPANGADITSSTLTISGWASDNIGVTRVDVLANWQGSWQTVGAPLLYSTPPTAVPFVVSLDLCAAGVSTGKVVDVAVRAYDVEGNATVGLPGARSLMMNYVCPVTQTSVCEPSADQVALFSEPGYKGTCEIFNTVANNGYGPGWYTSSYLGLVGDNNTASVKVGANVRAILYDNGSFSGRPTTLEGDDANLNDNRLGGIDRLSSIIVQSRGTAPEPPVIDPPQNGIGLAPTSADSLVIAWWRGSAVDYYATLNGPVSLDTGTWITANTWSVGSLPAGSYNLTVKARNAGGTSQDSLAFTVAAGSLPSGTVLQAPVELNMNDGAPGWTKTGLWRLGTATAQGSAGPLVQTRNPKTVNLASPKTIDNYWASNNGVDYVNNDLWGHDLTSPLISIPANGTWWMSFDEYVFTESPYSFWDRRLVQVAVEGGSFEDVYTLWDDPQQYWQSGPLINLDSYRGQKIRVRFHFDTIDKYYNNTTGWWIDNVRVFQNDNLPGSCVDSPADNSLAQARDLPVNTALTGYICGAGDVDYFKFQGVAGQHVAFDIDAQSIGSSLDAFIYLLDENGGFITQQDDEVTAQVIDPLLGYTPTRSGTYYIKLKAWNHPGVGGQDYAYRIRAVQDDQQPSVVITTPLNSAIPSGAFTISASASDSGTGVNRVEFYVHAPDWQANTWQLLGVDFYDNNGYSMLADPAVLGNLTGGAIYVRAVDGAGNARGDLRVNLQAGGDSTPPSVSLENISTPVTSTLLTLNWSGTDDMSGIDHYELDYRAGTGDWIGIGGAIPPEQTNAYFLAELNTAYTFRLRATDKAGNLGAYSQKSVSIGGCNTDSYENGDDSPSGAIGISLGGSQEHNLCAQDDADWLRLGGMGGRAMLLVQSTGGGAAFIVDLFDSSGTTLLARSQSGGVGQSAAITWFPAGGSYTVRIRPLFPNLAGTACTYRVSLGQAQAVHLPVIMR